MQRLAYGKEQNREVTPALTSAAPNQWQVEAPLEVSVALAFLSTPLIPEQYKHNPTSTHHGSSASTDVPSQSAPLIMLSVCSCGFTPVIVCMYVFIEMGTWMIVCIGQLYFT